MIRKSVCVYQNQLCVSGLWLSNYGVVPFYSCIPLAESHPDGPVIGTESPAIESALETAKQTIMATNQKKVIESSVQSLVLRARQGDQNAMGMLASVRAAAKEGSKRAVYAFNAAKRYVRANPVGATASRLLPSPANTRVLEALRDVIESDLHYASAVMSLMPGVTKENIDAASVVLANGPALSGQRLHDIYAVGGEAFVKAFRALKSDNIAAEAIRKARHIQMIRAGVGLKRVDSALALELE